MLRNLEDKDQQGMLEWMQDSAVVKNFRFNFDNATLETAQNFIIRANKAMEEREEFHFAIVDDMDHYVGTISLKNLDWKALTAEYAICVKGNCQGKGYGAIATREILKKGFEELGLRRIYLNVISENKTAIALYKKMGFIFEGKFRQHIYIRGQIYSLCWYSMLLEEYREVYNNEVKALKSEL